MSDPLPADVVYVTSGAQLEPLLPALRAAPRLGLDVETAPAVAVVAELEARERALATVRAMRDARALTLAELEASVAVPPPPKPKRGQAAQQQALPVVLGWCWADRRAAKHAVAVARARLKTADTAVATAERFTHGAPAEALRKASATNPREARLRLVQLAIPDGPHGAAQTVVVDRFLAGDEAVALLGPLFGDPEGPVLLSHNAHFEWAVLQAAGLPLPPVGRVVDTLLGALVLDAGEHRHAQGHFTLAAVAGRLLGRALDKTEQAGRWETPALTTAQLAYAAEDARVLLALDDALDRALLEKDPTRGLLDVTRLEYDALPAVAWMMHAGIGIDVPSWEALADAAAARVPALREAVRAHLGADVDPGSPAQLLPALRAAGVDVPNTQEDTLEGLLDPPPVVRALLDYREAAKQASTYGRAFLALVDPRTGRVHAGYRQLGADSGRMSCSKPNMQNIPRNGAYRRCFVAPPGRRLVKTDLSQIELNAAAIISKDAALLDALAREVDLHRRTAAGLFKVPEGEVTDTQRSIGKTINFGALYGMGKPGLIKQAATFGERLSGAQAGTVLADFKRTWPGFARWADAQRRDDDPVVVTAAGRWRTLPVGAQGTQRINTPVQGTAADCFKAGLALLWETRGRAPSAVLVAAVHDELVIECDEAEVDDATRWVADALILGAKRFLGADAPIRVKSTVGQTWGDTE